MDIVDITLRFIGIAGVVIIIIAFVGYGFLCSLTYGLEDTEINDSDPDDDPDPGKSNVIVKIPDTLEVSGIFFFFFSLILLLQFLLL